MRGAAVAQLGIAFVARDVIGRVVTVVLAVVKEVVVDSSGLIERFVGLDIETPARALER